MPRGWAQADVEAMDQRRWRVLLIVMGGWLALFALGTLITEGQGSFGRLLVNVIYLVPHVLAIGLAVWAARRTEGVYKRLWTMLACALPLWVAGESIVSYYHVVLSTEPPFPGVADAFFVAFYVTLIATFLVALRPALNVRSWKAVLDASVLAVAVGFVGWVALVEPQLSQAASLATVGGRRLPDSGRGDADHPHLADARLLPPPAALAAPPHRRDRRRRADRLRAHLRQPAHRRRRSSAGSRSAGRPKRCSRRLRPSPPCSRATATTRPVSPTCATAG